MRKYRILFLVGKDRPGIVDDVSTFLFERKANIEDSRMTTMGGRFSIMTLFSSSASNLEVIKADFKKLMELGFDVSLHEAEDPAGFPNPAELPLNIEVTAMDHPGIVQKIVRLLHRHHINIQSLNTKVIRAPLSGAPLFNLYLETGLPETTSVSEVKKELTELAAELNLDLNYIK